MLAQLHRVTLRVHLSLTLQVEANLAGIGISVTTPEAEVLYVLLDGIRARATSSKVSRTGEACIRTIQASSSAACLLETPYPGSVYHGLPWQERDIVHSLDTLFCMFLANLDPLATSESGRSQRLLATVTMGCLCLRRLIEA